MVALITLQSAASAGTVGSAIDLLSATGGIELKLRNFESIHVDNGTVGQIDIGDTLRGVFQITSSAPISGGDERFPVGFELTGIFETQVSGVSAPDAFGNSLFEFVPYASFATEFVLPVGTMIAFYEDYTPNFGAGIGTAGTIAAAEALATDGTLFAAFGADVGSTWGVDYYWNAIGDATPFVTATPNVATFAASLQSLFAPVGTAFTDTFTQAPVVGTPIAQAALLAAIVNELALQGNVTTNTSFAPGTGNPYPLRSQDPIRVNIVPEPASMSVFGLLSLCGGLALRRRR